jgi:hypothetical protein
MAEQVIIDLALQMSRFQNQLNQGIAASRRFDRAITELIMRANRLENALNSLDTSLKLDVDLGDLNRAINRVDAIDGRSPNIDVQVDSSELDRLESDINAVDGQTPNVDVQVDKRKVEDVQSEIQGIDGQTPNVTVQADAGQLEQVVHLLQQVRSLSVIDVVMNMAGGGIIEAITGAPIVSDIVDIDGALTLFQRSTGLARDEFDGLDVIINDQFATGLGHTRGEIALVAADLVKAGVSMEDLPYTLSQTLATAANTGEDVNTILQTQSSLVRTGLAGSYSEAADMITRGFQLGLNVSGDFLDTLHEYAPVFQSMGLTADQSLAFLNSGLQAGAFNTDKLGDSLKELQILLTEALTAGEGATFDALTALDLVDDAEAFKRGETTGADFIQGVRTALADPALTEAQRQQYLIDIFGTPVEDVGAANFLQIDPAAINAGVGITAGMATDAMQTGRNPLQMMNEIIQLARNDLSEAMRIGGRPLTEILDEAKIKLQEVIDLMRDGKSLPDAIEIAFQAQGFSESIDRFQSFIGNLFIEILNGFANVLDGLGYGEAAANIRGFTAQASERQLGFDIQLAESEAEFAQTVETALNRGVSAAGVGAAITTAINEAIAAGNFAEAQRLIDATGTSQQNQRLVTYTNQSGNTSQIVITVDPEMTEEQINDEAWRAAFDSGNIDPLNLAVTVSPMIEIDTSGSEATLRADMEAEINRLIGQGDYNAALPIAIQIGDQALIDAVRSGANAVFTSQIIPSGPDQQIGSPIYGAPFPLPAGQAAPWQFFTEQNATFTIAMTEQTEAVEAGSEAVGLLGDETARLATDGVRDMGLFGNAAEDVAARTEEAWNRARDAIEGARNRALGGGVIDPVVMQIQLGLNPTTTASPSPENPIVIPPANNQSGGLVTAGTQSYVSEDGKRELITAQTDLAVLNNRTTEALFSGIAAGLNMAGGRGGGDTFVNVYITQNNNGLPQAASGNSNLVRQIRGF